MLCTIIIIHLMYNLCGEQYLVTRLLMCCPQPVTQRAYSPSEVWGRDQDIKCILGEGAALQRSSGTSVLHLFGSLLFPTFTDACPNTNAGGPVLEIYESNMANPV